MTSGRLRRVESLQKRRGSGVLLHLPFVSGPMRCYWSLCRMQTGGFPLSCWNLTLASAVPEQQL